MILKFICFRLPNNRVCYGTLQGERQCIFCFYFICYLLPSSLIGHWYRRSLEMIILPRQPDNIKWPVLLEPLSHYQLNGKLGFRSRYNWYISSDTHSVARQKEQEPCPEMSCRLLLQRWCFPHRKRTVGHKFPFLSECSARLSSWTLRPSAQSKGEESLASRVFQINYEERYPTLQNRPA